MNSQINSIVSWDKVKEQKITISVATLILGVMFLWNAMDWSRTWHEANFFTSAEAQDFERKLDNRQQEFKTHLDHLEGKVDGNTVALNTLTDEFRLYAAISRVSQLEEKMDRHCGSSSQPHTPEEDRLHRDIQHELNEAKEYKACIIAGRNNCHLLQNQR